MTYHSKKFDFKVFKSEYSHRNIGVALELDLSEDIDHYAYHDAPSSVWIGMTLDDLIAIRNKLTTAIEKYEELRKWNL